MLGIAGGIVPCPTATIIMLLGVGTGIVAGALYAIVVFSLGLALTLMLVGFLALSSRRYAARLLLDADKGNELSPAGKRLLHRILPTLSGLAVVILGTFLTIHYIYRLTAGRTLFSWLG